MDKVCVFKKRLHGFLTFIAEAFLSAVFCASYWNSAISNRMVREGIVIMKSDFTQFIVMRAKGKAQGYELFLNCRYFHF